MYGTQAESITITNADLFENDVNMYGTQADKDNVTDESTFENDVNMYGTQARQDTHKHIRRLRMM